MGARAWVEYQPKGVVGVIAPWNFPVQLSVGPVAGAFAAGNRCMVKSSEITPAVAALFEELTPKLFDATELAFFSGGPDVGQAFAALPFDHLIFTGATGIGRHILHAAADNLTPVTLELGGKSPTILGKGADVAKAASRIAMGKMMNAGQICLAPDYVLTPADQEGALVEALKASVAQMYPTLLANPDYTSVVNDRHHVRLSGYLDDARAKGAEVIEVNPGGESFAGANLNKMPLYIVREPTDDMRLMQEEIFGPILPVKRYAGIDEAIGLRQRPRPAPRPVLLRRRRSRATAGAGEDHLRRRDAERHPVPLRHGRPALRRRRPLGHGLLSRLGRLQDLQPRQGDLQAGEDRRSQARRHEAALRQGGPVQHRPRAGRLSLHPEPKTRRMEPCVTAPLRPPSPILATQPSRQGRVQLA